MEFVDEEEKENLLDKQIEDDLDDWIDDNGEDFPPIRDFFSSQTSPNMMQFLEFLSSEYQFDFRELVLSLCKDSFDFIKLVNYIRSQSTEMADLDNQKYREIQNLLTRIKESDEWKDDRFMKPTIEDDSLLFLFEDVFTFAADDEEERLIEEELQQHQQEALIKSRMTSQDPVLENL